MNHDSSAVIAWCPTNAGVRKSAMVQAHPTLYSWYASIIAPRNCDSGIAAYSRSCAGMACAVGQASTPNGAPRCTWCRRAAGTQSTSRRRRRRASSAAGSATRCPGPARRPSSGSSSGARAARPRGRTGPRPHPRQLHVRARVHHYAMTRSLLRQF